MVIGRGLSLDIKQGGIYAECISTTDFRYFPIAFPTKALYAINSCSSYRDIGDCWVQVIDNEKFITDIGGDFKRRTDDPICMVAAAGY